MDKQWYVTVGVPGGEYAVQAEADDKWLVRAFATNDEFYEDTSCGYPKLRKRGTGEYVTTRTAPPELVWWLGLPMHEWIILRGDSTDRVMRVEGGLLYLINGCISFVPVALASGITVVCDE